MLQPTLQFIRDAVDQFLRNKFGLSGQVVVINHVIDSNGEPPIKNQNKVVISLLNIEKESARPYMQARAQATDGSYSKIQPAHRYNLDILISSHFDGYDATLKFLDSVLLFFQQYPSIESSSFSNLPKEIRKIDFEMEQISYLELQNLWSAMRATYQPSVIFKTRILSLQAGESSASIPQVTDTNTNIES